MAVTLARNNAPFHPADAVWVRRAYRMGWRSAKRDPSMATMDARRTAWLNRHDDNLDLVARLCDWEDGFLDAADVFGRR